MTKAIKRPIDENTSGATLLRRFFREHLKAQVPKIFIAIICMMVAAGTTAGLAWMMQPVLDKVFVNKQIDLLKPVALLVVFLSFTKGMTTFLHNVIMKTVAQRITCDMQNDLFRHLLQSDVALFANNSSGGFISRFTNDISLVRASINSIMISMIREPITMAFLVGVMFYQNVKLALIATIVLPLAIYPVVWLGRRMRKVSTRTQEVLGKLTSSLEDTFQGIRIVKAYGQEEFEKSHTTQIVEKSFKLYAKHARLSSASGPIMETLAGMAIASVIAYGGIQVMQGQTTPGAFFSFMTALIMAYRPMKSSSSVNAALQQAFAALTRFYSVLDTETVIKDAKGAEPLTLSNTTIKFHDVSFKYNSEKTTLKDLSFTVESGKTVALVGHSGAGKSTIMNLILRFYDPDSGKITIGGEDIKKHTLSSLRGAIAIVTQETTLFDNTVAANIRYGKSNATHDEIVAAAKAAAADEFIQKLPNGYDTMIGQQGIRLSGGQRQRIAIARAMLRNAPILLLDEATSSLDTTSEQQIHQALDVLMRGRTTLVIAHRLSTIEAADVIYVIKDGQVVESGNHKSLLKLEGEYATLYNRQFKGDRKKSAA